MLFVNLNECMVVQMSSHQVNYLNILPFHKNIVRIRGKNHYTDTLQIQLTIKNTHSFVSIENPFSFCPFELASFRVPIGSIDNCLGGQIGKVAFFLLMS